MTDPTVPQADDDPVVASLDGGYGYLTDPATDPIRLEWTRNGRLRLIRLLPKPTVVFDVLVREVAEIGGVDWGPIITAAGYAWRLTMGRQIARINFTGTRSTSMTEMADRTRLSGWPDWVVAFRNAGVRITYRGGISGL